MHKIQTAVHFDCRDSYLKKTALDINKCDFEVVQSRMNSVEAC